MSRELKAAAALLSVVCAAIMLSGHIFGSAAYADADDQTQVVMLTNFLLTGNYGWPQQTQIQRMSVYHNYALVQLNAPLPAANASASPSASPTGSPGPPSPGAVSPTPSSAAVSTPTPRPPASGPSSYVAIKTHRNWIFQFSKSGVYNQADLVAAGVPKDIAAGLIEFLNPPRPQPSPSP